ncbi:GNAT family N-acetyltransferase [Devosia sp. FJ2-5-3]|uniref:GNAT family N-acetyltransferase n=1 Tax=Devosia sp. FJ2-5-3 TaxID=2976680 RepID=UPI0023D88D1D|nr:GNAT family N-acetyltransferase [Devosia sp. FJ2-5-3]WEJ58985.1 GNAT family N-acetyltransferase [Devosia sp. FJ2-5-3]
MPLYRIDPFPTDPTLDELWRRAWNAPLGRSYQGILSRSLGHLCAYEAERLVGFVNIAWDGGVHAFILDTCTDRDFRRRGIATELVKRAADLARERGAEWLHVDYEPHLHEFHSACGFVHSAAGVMKLS